MLAKYYRFHVYNDANATITFNDGGRIIISLLPWKMTSGAMALGAEITGTDTIVFDAGKSVANGVAFEGVVIDNSSDLFIGANGTIEVAGNVNPTLGVIRLLMETSTDNGVWPSDQADFDALEDLTQVVVLNVSIAVEDHDRATNFEI